MVEGIRPGAADTIQFVCPEPNYITWPPARAGWASNQNIEQVVFAPRSISQK